MTDQKSDETSTEQTSETEEKKETPQVSETEGTAEERLTRMADALKKANNEAAKSRKKLEALEQVEKDRADAEKSETEKLRDQLAEANTKLAKIEREGKQRLIADRVGLPAVFATRIQGETPEEMEADAKTLLEAMPKKSVTSQHSTNPNGDNSDNRETDDQRRKRLLG